MEYSLIITLENVLKNKLMYHRRVAERYLNNVLQNNKCQFNKKEVIKILKSIYLKHRSFRSNFLD